MPIETEHRIRGRKGGLPPLIAIVGPTAIGKSALALELAENFRSSRGVSGEIVSADSRQVYRTLDIGTAKASIDEQRRVRHHLIDLVEPKDDFTLADFQDRAHLAIAAIHCRGGVPILVGGTGLYVRAIADGLELPRVAPDPEFRARLEAESRLLGLEELVQRLARVDAVAAERIDSRNQRRVIRALEVIEKTGRPFSQAATLRPRYDVIRIGLTGDRGWLYRLIDARVDRQMAAGLVDETRRALAGGCSPTRPALSGFGYRQAVQYLSGELDLETATQRYKFETHRFVRQQYTWFRLGDPAIHWIESNSRSLSGIVELVNRFIDRGHDQRRSERK